MPIESDRAGPTRGVSATLWSGVALGVAGAVLLFLGWWGVSGESLIALQLPYLASASIPGAALLITGGVLIASEPARRSAHDSERMIARLYDLLTEAPLEVPLDSQSPPGPARHTAVDDAAKDDGPAVDEHDTQLVALSGGTRYHRRGCALVEGKPGVMSVDSVTIRSRALQPCPICTPTLVES
jgi:hypothetical protein